MCLTMGYFCIFTGKLKSAFKTHWHVEYQVYLQAHDLVDQGDPIQTLTSSHLPNTYAALCKKHKTVPIACALPAPSTITGGDREAPDAYLRSGAFQTFENQLQRSRDPNACFWHLEVW